MALRCVASPLQLAAIDKELGIRFKEAVDLAGVEPAYHDSLGWTYLRLGDATRAQKAFDAALERRRSAFSLYGRSLALRRLGAG